jgi:hypothetical protein
MTRSSVLFFRVHTLLTGPLLIKEYAIDRSSFDKRRELEKEIPKPTVYHQSLKD